MLFNIFAIILLWWPAILHADSLDDELSALRAQAVEVSQRWKEAGRNERVRQETLLELREKEAALTEKLAEENGRLSRMLSHMAQASRAAPVTAFDTSDEHIRTAKMMDVTNQSLQEEAAKLRQSMTEISELRQKMLEEERAREAAAKALAEEYTALQQIVKERQARFEALQPAEKKLQRVEQRRLVSQAKHIEGLIKIIEQDASMRLLDDTMPEKAGVIDADSPTLAFHLPSEGKVVKQFDMTAQGMRAPELHIKAAARSLLFAPYDGEVVFSGPFRSYGSLMLIKHKQGYMSLISGFAEPAVEVGQWVNRGEPIGYMGRKVEGPVRFELRKGRKAIDPMPLIAHGVSGAI